MNSSRQILETVSLIAAIAVSGATLYSLVMPSSEKAVVVKDEADEAKEKFSSPSFDCIKATNKAESLICATPEIAILDLRMTNTYRDVWAEQKNVTQKNLLKGSQTSWLQEIRNNCDDAKCLKSVYAQRIAVLTNARK